MANTHPPPTRWTCTNAAVAAKGDDLLLQQLGADDAVDVQSLVARCLDRVAFLLRCAPTPLLPLSSPLPCLAI
jgi:hypothetical protein